MASETTIAAPLTAAATGAPRFLIPSHVWYGLASRLDGVHRAAAVPALSDGGWGGLLTSDDDVGNALLTVDAVLLLLNLAGYQVPEVVIGVPVSGAETAAGDLISVDKTTMEIHRGTARANALPGTTPPSAHVSLWVEARYSGGAIPLQAAAPGWLHLAWPVASTGAEWWGGDLAAAVDHTAAALADEIAAAYVATQGQPDPVLSGLLSMYDPRTWSVPFPSDPPFNRITPGVTLFGERLSELVTGATFGAFLRDEIALAPPTAATRWPRGTTDDARRQAVDDLSWCADELAAQCLDGAVTDPDIAADFAGNAWTDVDALSVTALLLRWQELGVLDFLAPIEAVSGVEVYGGYDLRRGDNDTTRTYGGVVRDGLPAPLERGYVEQLRADLATLGFGPMSQYAGTTKAPIDQKTFDVWLERAVREFQLYARMPNLAQEVTGDGAWVFYGDKLGQVPNPAVYTGPVCGVVNGETRALIALWLGDNLRCPIVVEARSAASKFTAPLVQDGATDTDNVWRANQVQALAAKARFYARDFTGHWAAGPGILPAGQALELFTLGQWTDQLTDGPWTDPPSTTWPSAEITTDSFVGNAVGACTPAERSTFRVIRAVSEVECIGYFDCFNAYDPGFISAGPFHWILGHAGKTQSDPAELPPYFAYLKSLGGAAAQAAYDAFGVFGCGVDREWVTSGPQSPCWEPKEHKYNAWITFEDEHGNALVAPTKGNEGGEWFRQWHWFARFALNARTNSVLRTRMWDYARLRLRDVLGTEWEPKTMIADGKGSTRPATIGDYFSSERAAGVILRWHVNQPSDIFPLAGSKLVQAFNNAQASTWGDPSTWTDARQETLVNALYDLRPPDPPDDPDGTVKKDWLRESLQNVYQWPASWGKNPRKWKLPLDPLMNYPHITGLVNGRTDAGRPYAANFTVDPRDGVARTPTATSSDKTVVGDAGIAITGTGPAYTLTATPLKAGSTTITVTADNGKDAASARFVLTVGGPVQAGDPPAPTVPTLGLSTRNRSFVLDTSPPL
jgi:hypothetical protein